MPLHYSRRVARFFLAAALLNAPAGADAQTPPAFAEQVEARVFMLVNDARTESGLQPLEREARLDATARDFAEFMAASGRLDHRADGKTPGARVRQRGYDYCVISENIAHEYSSRGFAAERLARSFVEGWLQSPVHRENMLDATVTQTGLGVSRGARNEYYVAHIFGRPAVGGVQASGPKAKNARPARRRC